MELLRELSEKDIGIDEKKQTTYKLRRASRAVLFDKEGKIAFTLCV